MTDAVRTILECLGEDPTRDGLLKTPERYAKALMWMTRGYEERLAGATPFISEITFHVLNRQIHRRYQRRYLPGRP